MIYRFKLSCRLHPSQNPLVFLKIYSEIFRVVEINKCRGSFTATCITGSLAKSLAVSMQISAQLEIIVLGPDALEQYGSSHAILAASDEFGPLCQKVERILKSEAANESGTAEGELDYHTDR